MNSIKLLSAVLLFAITPCSAQPEDMQVKNETPVHLQVWRGLSVRKDGRIIDAPAEDVALAKDYPSYETKGESTDDTRLTILSSKKTYKIGEEVRVIHVVESTKSGYKLYIMGPKTIFGETVNGVLKTPAVPDGIGDPLIPMIYDGAVIDCPAVDYNYEISTYKFDKVGEYIIQWDLGSLKSNSLKITVE